jgi:peptidoglycan/xylan/chitin deacetylase (PgdA/CDA1 family)
MNSYLNKLYYNLKPIIPRRLQISIRRRLVLRKRSLCINIWPIDEKASKPPEGWSGWPDHKKFAFVLMHDVDTKVGHSKCRQLMQIDEEMGFRSLFNFVPERYNVSPELRQDLVKRGFEVGVHGLKHDGKLFLSRKKFYQQAIRINHYLKEWKSVGFVSPSMHRNLDWIHELNIEYDASTFDTDPFEPQPDGMATIFPFLVHGHNVQRGYIELPYTLPQDFTLFVIMKERNINIWKKKLEWIVEKGGMALLITHPDYMNCKKGRCKTEEYPIEFYEELLDYIKREYEGQYWNPLPKEMACFWKENRRDFSFKPCAECTSQLSY